MSNISTILDQLRSELPGITGWSTKTLIPNAYALEDNNHNLLVNGYGIAVEGATPNAGNLNRIHETRQITIFITKEYVRTDGDTASVLTNEKSLLEDAVLLKQEMEGPNQINIPSSVELINLDSDTGIQFVFKGKNNFMYIGVTFNIRYSEALSC